MILNPEQEAAANSIDGVYATVAGPGSGKTTVLIERFKRMLVLGISAQNILNLTFTNSAAKNLVEKAGFIDSESIFRTFHSFAMDLLRQERDHLPFQLCDTVIPVHAEEYTLLFELTKAYPAIKNFRMLKDKISEWKRTNVDPAQAIMEASGEDYYLANAYKDYEEECRQQGWLDFDSVMRQTVWLLETNEGVRNRWKRKYIAVDEFQDTDVVQHRMLQLIFDGNLFAVGDESQLIYAWRSAQEGNLTNLDRSFPGCKKLYLGHNYRSTKKLVQFLKEILPVQNGLASHMTTDNEEGVDPVITKYAGDFEEAEKVLDSITDPLKTAIIARTNRQLFTFQKACMVRGMKYKILGKKDFWEQSEVKKLLNLAKDSNDLRPATTVLTDLIQRNRLLEIYRHAGNPLESSPIDNLNSIVKMSANRGNVHEFLSWLRKMTHARRSVKGLTLATVHQAKGMEFNHVFLVGCEQGILPHKNGELNEERRIFFVGCSRAAKTLNISFSNNHSMFLNDYVGKIKVESFGGPDVG